MKSIMTTVTMTTYTVKRLTLEDLDETMMRFIARSATKVNRDYGGPFNFKHFDLSNYIEKGRFMVCWKKGRPVGAMLYHMVSSLFDPTLRILRQDLLYCPYGGRAAYLLMQEFIDFGRSNADHIITMIGARTNIKRQSLEKLGFTRVEELYRIEV